MDQTSTFHQRTRRAAENSLHVLRLNIGPRLILCFAIILLAVFVGDAVVLWQFHFVRAQAEQLNGIDQKLVAVLRFHASLLAVHDKLEELTVSEDAARLVTEAGPLRTAVLEEAQRAKTVLSLCRPTCGEIQLSCLLLKPFKVRCRCSLMPSPPSPNWAIGRPCASG